MCDEAMATGFGALLYVRTSLRIERRVAGGAPPRLKRVKVLTGWRRGARRRPRRQAPIRLPHDTALVPPGCERARGGPPSGWSFSARATPWGAAAGRGLARAVSVEAGPRKFPHSAVRAAGVRRCTRTLYCCQRGASRLCRWGQQRRARDCSRPPRCLGGRGPGHQLACARRLRRSGRLALVLRHPQLPPTLDRDGSPQSQPRVPVKGRWGAAAGAEPPETRRWEAQRAPRARSGRRGVGPKRGSAPRRCRGRGTVPGPGPMRGLGRRAAATCVCWDLSWNFPCVR